MGFQGFGQKQKFEIESQWSKKKKSSAGPCGPHGDLSWSTQGTGQSALVATESPWKHHPVALILVVAMKRPDGCYFG